MSTKGKSIDTESILVVAKSWEWEQGLTVSGHVGSFWGDENAVKINYGDGHATQ